MGSDIVHHLLSRVKVEFMKWRMGKAMAPVLASLLLLVLLWQTLPVRADDSLPAAAAHALVPLAPEGRWVVRAELRRNGYDQRYNSAGERESLAAPFDQIDLNSAIFPALAALGGGASLGSTSLSSSVTIERTELTLGYGVTPDLTVGGIVNFGTTENRVSLGLGGGNTGWNPAFDPSQPIAPANFPFAPVGGGALAPMDAVGLNQILTNPAFGYGYAPLASASTSGPGSALVGALWRSYQDGRSALVWGFGYRFGLAAADDPDNLFDVPLDDGSDDLVGQVEYFRHWGVTDLRLMAKRTVQLKDQLVMRVPLPGEVLAPASSKERLDRNLGDFWEYDVELGRSWGDWRPSITWHRWQKSPDSFTSPSGQDTTALEANTNIDTNQWRMALSWSGINAWRRGVMPLPLVARLEMQESYEGRNMVDVRDYYLTLTTFF